jgi:hypothetical protein
MIVIHKFAVPPGKGPATAAPNHAGEAASGAREEASMRGWRIVGMAALLIAGGAPGRSG